MTATPTLAQLRHYAVRHSIGRPAGLLAAIKRLGFVQADPIRAPARAQDLILYQRVRNYRAGQLERLYPTLPIEEDHFVNYGFLSREMHSLLHPRKGWRDVHIYREAPGLAEQVLEFVAGNGPTHPRQLTAALGRRQLTGAWGGTSEAATQALDALHYQGKLRVVRRDNGIKVFGLATAEERAGEQLGVEERARRLLIAIVDLYAPVEASTLASLLRFMGAGAPELRIAARAFLKDPAFEAIRTETIDGMRYSWPAEADFDVEAPEKVRFLAPFDPVAWDRVRFEHFHGWAYRFEAYTPPAKRLRGYYSLPLLWRERIIGWANISVVAGELVADIGYANERPASKAFTRELEAEIGRMRTFLGLAG